MEERRLPISYIKTELSCKICSTTEGNMEAIPCRETNRRLIRKIYHCTNVQVHPINDVISPVCDPCRELIDSYDLHAKPILRDFVIKADMNVTNTNYDPFAENQDNAPEDPVDILEPIVKIESLPPQVDLVSTKNVEKYPEKSNPRKKIELVEFDTDDEDEIELHMAPKRPARKKIVAKKKSSPMSKSPEKILEPIQSSPPKTKPLEKRVVGDESDFSPLSDSDDSDSQPLSKLKPIKPEKVEGQKKKKGRPKSNKPKKFLQKCEVCGKVVYYLREHMRCHRSERYNCPVCDRTFAFKQSMKYHILKHKGERPYECDVCGNRYVSKGELNHHMEAHSTELKYQCDVCSKAFNQAPKLRLHLKIHLGIKRKIKVQYFTCEMCGRVFNNKNNLNVHMMRHKGEKNFVCEICSKAFVNVPALKRHTEFHNRQEKILALEGAVRCDICGKAYTNKSNLTVHLKTHEPGYKHTWDLRPKNNVNRPKGEKLGPAIPAPSGPANCDVCFKYFDKACLMRKHRTRHFDKDGQERKMRDRIRLVPDEHTPRCDICDRPFAKIKYMNEHRKKHFTERGVNGNRVEDMSLADKVMKRRSNNKSESTATTSEMVMQKVVETELPRVYPHPQFHYPGMPNIIKLETLHR